MRRALAVLVGALALVACGDAAPEPETFEPQWQTVTDPETDRSFRCWLSSLVHGYGAGLTSWCYELEEGE